MNLYKSLALAAAASLSIAAHAAPVLVGNGDMSGVSLSDSDLEAVLLGKTVSLNGKRVVIVLAKSSSAQEEFLKSKVGKTDSQFNNHWRKLFMTGGGVAPTQVDGETDIVSKVASTSGSIGIVDESNVGNLSVLAR